MHLRVVLLLVLKHHSPSRGFLSGRTSLYHEHLSKTQGRFWHPLEDREDHAYSIPKELAVHESATAQESYRVDSLKSRFIFKNTNTPIPVGLRKLQTFQRRLVR